MLYNNRGVNGMNQASDRLGKVVRRARKSKNMSQEALAEKIGVCKRTIIDIENSAGNPKFTILFPLVRELNLPLQQVFYPESSEDSEAKMLIIQELEKCDESESRIVLSVLKSLLFELKKKKRDK